MKGWFPWLKPKQFVSHVTRIDFHHLRSGGIVYAIVDVDNTLRPIVPRCDGEEFDVSGVNHLGKLLEYGVIHGICLMSNVMISSQARIDRIHRLAAQLGTTHVVLCDLKHRKPKPWGYLEAMRLMCSTLNNTVVIGDQLFTDVKGGNALGLYTIWVKPLGRDRWYTMWKRLPEWILLRLFWGCRFHM